jgi:hypothetical protein
MACTADKTAAMLQCIFCDHELTAETKPKHILQSTLCGRMMTTRVDRPSCNVVFGNTIDKTVVDQVASRSED